MCISIVDFCLANIQFMNVLDLYFCETFELFSPCYKYQELHGIPHMKLIWTFTAVCRLNNYFEKCTEVICIKLTFWPISIDVWICCIFFFFHLKHLGTCWSGKRSLPLVDSLFRMQACYCAHFLKIWRLTCHKAMVTALL